jgi:hypothetical protein
MDADAAVRAGTERQDVAAIAGGGQPAGGCCRRSRGSMEDQPAPPRARRLKERAPDGSGGGWRRLEPWRPPPSGKRVAGRAPTRKNPPHSSVVGVKHEPGLPRAMPAGPADLDRSSPPGPGEKQADHEGMHQEVGGRDQTERREHAHGPVQAVRSEAKVTDHFGHGGGQEQRHDSHRRHPGDAPSRPAKDDRAGMMSRPGTDRRESARQIRRTLRHRSNGRLAAELPSTG